MTTPAVDPGFLAVTTPDDARFADRVQRILAHVGPAASVVRDGTITLLSWGIDPDPSGALLLGRFARWRDQYLTTGEVDAMLRPSRWSDLADALPPFAGVRLADGELTVATDAIGYRHVYLISDAGWAAASTTLEALATLTPLVLDREALAVQSLLGWQLGRRTIYEGVEKLPAGHVAVLSNGHARVVPYTGLDVPERRPPTDVVRDTASFLRGYLDAYLDQQPAATLQLSGGQDSRILLSAIAPQRRRGLATMTLVVPGSDDAPIAEDLARREQLDHRLSTLAGLDDLSAERAHDMAVDASRRIGHMANPLATAALIQGESQLEGGPRIAGLGGEVARGFYYAGPLAPWPVSARMAAMLARWRLFPNDSVPEGPLTPEFAAWARRFTITQVHAALQQSGRPFWEATDEFYLFQRMQRWAGVVDSASCFERETVNPMLDGRFLTAARALRPADKRGSRFLAQLQMALDPELGRIPLEGRPPPEAFARRGFASVWNGLATTTTKAVGKMEQRRRGARRPPAGGTVLAAKVLEHWRAQPDAAASLAACDFVDQQWLAAMLDGSVDALPSTLAFLLNVATALDAAHGW